MTHDLDTDIDIDIDTDSGRTPLSVLGLGLMGQALAAAFLGQGHPTTVWNRTPSKAEPLTAQGAQLARTVRDAVTAGPLVVICVSDYDNVCDILEPVSRDLAGRTLVNLTSGTSQAAREVAKWAAHQGAAYLDGAIMAVPPAIGTAKATILYSGPTAAFDQHRQALGSLGGSVYVGADHGLPSLFDAAVLSLVWSTLNGFLHGAALLGKAGIPATAFAGFAKAGIEAVADWVPGHAQQIDDGAYPATESTVDTNLAGMKHLLHESRAADVDAELPQLLVTLAERAVAEGYGGDSYAAIIEQLRHPMP
ncbi:NAD(P)-dependent oxidoreductase [Streptomyces sp. FH025]|uniref:NAD(P)-dependent oxidoreductase n=1 Tax=Streptomyces sp. FH025 TaxID=2815937 RepID=UPI001A9F5449|nr:NAD(P)-binding domain-containing protein [Streptomyces sp. FH025]MBO1414729.1 NAD(P)-dependent oxidoreductase [Streptomyces sp. FH025]